MYKVARVNDSPSLKVARGIMERIRAESPSHWPNGLSADHFDDGCYLILEKQSSTPIGFTGFQRRWEFSGDRPERVGYYSIGILPEYRGHGLAKEAVASLIAMKSAGVDRVQALIVEGNKPSLKLAESLGVPVILKHASADDPAGPTFVDNLSRNHPIIPMVMESAKALADKRLLVRRGAELAKDPTVYSRMWDDATEPVRHGYRKAKSEAEKLQLANYLSSFLHRR